MALLPIIYTSLIAVLGLFLLVFSFSYISYRLRKTPVKASYAHPQVKPESEKIKIKLREASEQINHPVLHNEKDIIVIHEEKKVSQNRHRNEKRQHNLPKKKDRFSVIKADDVRKFNHMPDNIAVNSFSRTTAISINDLHNKDILRFYDE